MKTHTALAVLMLALPMQAAANESERNTDRYVADAMEVVILPTGDVVTRLVSRNRLTARQFWVDSVYQSRDSLLVYDGRGATTQIARAMPRERVVTARRNDNMQIPFPDLLSRATSSCD